MSDNQKDIKEIAEKDNDERFRSAFKTLLKNEHHTFAVQKTEKLASALYMVTGFIPGDDPLRTRLRSCALDLVSTCVDPDKARDSRYQDGFSSRCLEIGTILKLAERAGFISSMNAHILCDEYAELASFVTNHHDKVFGNMSIHVQEEKVLISDNYGPKPASASQGTRTQQNYTSSNPVRDTNTTPKKTVNSKRHSNRRDAILKLFNKKDKISIKDAVAAVEGCSDKTVQRELLSLVEEGVLLKEGERRWSTYRKA